MLERSVALEARLEMSSFIRCDARQYCVKFCLWTVRFYTKERAIFRRVIRYIILVESEVWALRLKSVGLYCGLEYTHLPASLQNDLYACLSPLNLN